MSGQKTKGRIESTSTNSDSVLLAKIARMLEILVRLNLHNLRGDRSQNDIIAMLDSLGCGQSEIAALLGTTPNTVNVSLYKSKRKTGKK